MADAREPTRARTQNPIVLVSSQEEAVAACQEIAREYVIGLDVETTIDEDPVRLCTVQMANRERTWVVDALRLIDLGPIRRILEDRKILKVIHWAPFERGVFKVYEIPIRNVFDTCVESRKIRGEDAEGGHGLAAVCQRELGLAMDKTHQKSDWTRRPLQPDQIEYAALDAEILMRLYPILSGGNQGNLLFT